MGSLLFVVLMLGTPIVVAALESALLDDIAERHHRHHDTYRISNSLTHTMVILLLFMGILGSLLAWLCDAGAFDVDAPVVLGFFGSFICVVLALWIMLHRHEVATYDSYLRVRPLVGSMRTIRYEDITRMEWRRSSMAVGYDNIWVKARHQSRPVTILGMLDLEQILSRINRFDALDRRRG
ncbi:hypothetical protein [Olsenella massiliensis]|uniref:hypothetical protein n=1 Tax=Olsenella massiliensis TaxID=1622075 RepID=UPI00071CE274|nr:hypothetical protein [Olsenella massiliensis]